MKNFFRCLDVDGEVVLLSEDAVKEIRRTDRFERADVLRDFDGNFYECYDEFCACPSYTSCIVNLEGVGHDSIL